MACYSYDKCLELLMLFTIDELKIMSRPTRNMYFKMIFLK